MMHPSIAPSLATLALCLATSASAANYTAFDPPGSIYTQPAGINSSGAITGFYAVDGQNGHGFVRAPDGTIASFDPDSAVLTDPAAIDDAGRICGRWITRNRSHEHGFVRDADGTITVFDPPHSKQTNPVGFDGDGNVVGFFSERISKG